MRATWVLLIALTVITGCQRGSRSTPSDDHTSVPEAKLVDEFRIEFTQSAREQLFFIANQQKFDGTWFVRIQIVPGGCQGMTTLLELEPIGAEENETVTSAEDLFVLSARDQGFLVQGATIDWKEVDGKLGFDVTFPHKTPENQSKTQKWIEDEFQKRLKSDNNQPK